MAPPTQKEIHVALSAIRSDARKWEGAAEVADTAGASARGIQLNAAQFSYFADKAGITQTYEQLQDKVVTLLNHASKNFAKISHTLEKCARDYEENEKKNTEILHGPN
ncbi:MAG: hypothetical protein ACRDRN_01070 [Sciscionella sp.]